MSRIIHGSRMPTRSSAEGSRGRRRRHRHRRDGVTELHLAVVLVDVGSEPEADERAVLVDGRESGPFPAANPSSYRLMNRSAKSSSRGTGKRVNACTSGTPQLVDRVSEIPGRRTSGRSRAITVRVSDLPQGQSVRRCDLAGHLPRAGGEDVRDGVDVELAHADVDERAGDRPPHLMTERVRTDFEPKQPRRLGSRTGVTSRLASPQRDRRPSRRTSRPDDVADERLSGSSSPTFARGGRTTRSRARRQAGRRPRSSGRDREAGAPTRPGRRAAGSVSARSTRGSGSDAVSPRTERRSGRGSRAAERTATSGAQSLFSRRTSASRSVSSGRSPDTTCPHACTPASVRPAPVSSTGARTTSDVRVDEHYHHGPHTLVLGEPAEPRAVVRNEEASLHEDAPTMRLCALKPPKPALSAHTTGTQHAATVPVRCRRDRGRRPDGAARETSAGCGADTAAAFRSADPDDPALSRPLGSGALVSWGAGRYVNRAIGVSLDALGDDDLDELEALYDSRGVPPSIEVLSWARPELLAGWSLVDTSRSGSTTCSSSRRRDRARCQPVSPSGRSTTPRATSGETRSRGVRDDAGGRATQP